MRNKTIIALFTALLAVMFVVTGCSLGPNYPGAKASGNGKLALSVRGLSARTIMPAVTYKAVITDASDEDAAPEVRSLSAGMNTFSLAAGTYNVTVTAYNGATAIAAATEEGVGIDPSKITQVNLTLKPIDSEATTGTFSWDLDAFRDAEDVGIKITSPDEVPVLSVFELGGDYSAEPIAWVTTETDSSVALTPKILQGAKYLILGLDSNGNGGVGGFQLAAQTSADGWGWHSWDVIGNWNSLAPDDGGFLAWDGVNIPFYLVIELADLTGLDTVLAGAQSKLILNSRDTAQVTLTAAYLTDEDLSDFLVTAIKFDGNTAGAKGYFTNVTPPFARVIPITAANSSASIKLPVGTYLVEFTVNTTKWNEFLWILPGQTSDYQPPFTNIFDVETYKLETLVLDAIADGKYTDLLATDFGLIGVAGVNAGNIGDIRSGLGILVDEEKPPADLAELKEVVDAVLVWAGAPLVDSSIQIAATTEIKGLVANGTTDITVDWTAFSDPDYEVKITVGAYAFSVSIIPPEEPEFFEELVLAQNNAVYRFTLPAGETFGNYKAIKVSYLEGPADATYAGYGNEVRATRLMGNYKESDATEENGFKYFNFNSYNAPYIYDDLGGAAAGAAGGAANVWYTLTYRLVGNNPNQAAALDKYPADTATGPFLFGVGIPGNQGKPKKQLLKNITMVHKTDPRKNVVTSDFYGFAGYPGPQDLDISSRAVVENPAFVKVEPEFLQQLTLAETYAVYRFPLPDGGKYEDYNAIKVSYKMDTANLALATRSVRLHGDYSAAITSFTPNANGIQTWAFDASNANYIYDDIGTGALTGAEADKWFTLTYKLVGNVPNNTFADKYPAATATGPFYFGIGIPGGSSGSASTPKIQLVKNITMVHKTDPRKNVVAEDFFGLVGKVDADNDATGWAIASSNVKYVPNPDYTGPQSKIIELDLTQHNLSTTTVGGAFGDGGAVGTDEANGSVTFKFTSSGNSEVAYIELDPADTATIMAASSLRVTITATATPATAKFRSCFGNVTKGSNWNDTSWIMPDNSTIASASGITQTVNVTRTGSDVNTHFLLQTRNNTPDVTVNITSILIRCMP